MAAEAAAATMAASATSPITWTGTIRLTWAGYDDHNRLTSYGSYRSYTYDAWNNLLSVSSSNGVGEAPNYTLTYATNGSGAPSTNRINNSGYTFDNAGNVTNDGSLAYTFDAAGRLKTAGTNNSCEYGGSSSSGGCG